MVDVSFLSKKGIRREHAVVETCKGEVSSREVVQRLRRQVLLRRQRDDEKR